MDALVMCGGRGSRFGATLEKPLVEVGGVPMVDRVIAALRGSAVETVYAITSPLAPETAKHVDAPRIETPGGGYVDDLRVAIDRVGDPVLTAAADLPLLAPEVIDVVLDQFHDRSLSVVVPAALKRHLGLDVETELTWCGRTVAATGVNIVVGSGPDDRFLTHDVRIAVNVNRKSDVTLAEDLL